MLRLEGSFCKGSASARSANFEAAGGIDKRLVSTREENQSSKYRFTASAARLPKELNSSLNGKVNSTGVIILSGRTRTVIVTSVSSTTQTFHFRPLDSMVRLFVCMFEIVPFRDDAI